MRVAFIGAGAMAGHHLQALRRVPTPHTVVGVQDLKPSAARDLAQRAGCPAYASVAELLEQTRPDLVHVCTPAGAHFEPARLALLAGAHVYVEKPFVESLQEADTLLAIARERGLQLCAGHQLVRDPAFRQVVARASELEPVTFVDSNFAFRPPRLDPYKSAERALAAQLLDVLPHPVSTLVAALEQFGPLPIASLEILNVSATVTGLHALVRVGDVTGRLSISLRARPVASTLTVTGAYGSLTADFVRTIVIGAANEGTSPVEKIANPFIEAGQLAWRSGTSLTRRLLQGADYPGLVELLSDFYAAVAAKAPAPLTPEHLRSVTAVYEQLAANVRSAIPQVALTSAAPSIQPTSQAPLAVVTGAGGFFGRAISRELARRGFRVRGVGRSPRPEDAEVHEWVRTDLAAEVDPTVLAGSAVVVHAAAETAGGFDAHERNSIGATRELLRAMAAAQVRRLVHISSISVLRPPRTFWERQGEQTPLASHAERLGAYTWGKCRSEELVAAAQARGEIDACVVRPAALIDWAQLELPGLLGRRLFGSWHLGLGRPGLPFAICDVDTAAAAVAWCADRFDEAPPVVNLIDPGVRTRGQLLERFRARGWRGRLLWTPISLLAGAAITARAAIGLARRERAQPMAIWSILRPRRYDTTVSAAILATAGEQSAGAATTEIPQLVYG